MEKEQFLALLREALQESLPETEIAGHIRYYREYIEGEVRRGKTEDQVTSMLGDPRLIAKTIVDAAEFAREGEGAETGGTSYEQNPHGTGAFGQESRENRPAPKSKHMLHLVIGIAVLLLILWFVAAVVSFLLPIVLPVAAVLLLFSYLRKR